MNSHICYSSKVKPEFSVRILVCDYYLTKPIPGVDVTYSEFRGSDIKQVPVLRIFGPASDGRKACLHIHGVFPYFYIPCPSSDPEPQLLYQISASLDKALNIALKQATSANQHVYKISLVKGLPFYGFHDKEHLYLKVFLYNPGLIKQAVELCSNGAILGQTFQPHESHLNFTLQFFIDFNLFGMSNIDLQNVSFRKNDQSQNSDDTFVNIGPNLKPESMCYYEADCVASHIINRQRIGRGDGIENPGLEEVWQQEMERRKQLNVSMASKSLSQARLNDETESHYKFEQMMLMKMSNVTDKPVIIDSPVDEIYYPAESREESQLLKAVDVSMHLPNSSSLNNNFSETFKRDMDETLTQDLDNTIVDESVALNCSLHYSQIPLNSQDLDLLSMLQDMDEEKPVEQDSDMASPAVLEQEEDIDDAEYSQAYDDDTILINPDASKEDDEEHRTSWNDSFWSGASIPQLDGTFDDEYVKKVRKRKMRPLKVGLSRPKQKKNIQNVVRVEEILSHSTESDDEIKVSQETIDSISSLHLKKAVKIEPIVKSSQKEDPVKCIKKETTSADSDTTESSIVDVIKNDINKNDISLIDLVKKITIKQEKYVAAESYDLNNRFEPLPGPSHLNMDETILNSSPEDNLGIVSFYNKSKIFDLSLNDSDTISPEVFIPSSNEIMDYVPRQDEIECIEEISQVESKELVCIKKGNSDKDENICMSIQPKDRIALIKGEVEEPAKDKYFNIEPTISNSDIKLHYSFTNCTMAQTNKSQEEKRKVCLTPKFRPPSKQDVIASLEKYNIPKVKNPEPFFSDPKDVGEKVEIGHMILKLLSKHACDQKPYERVLNTTNLEEWRQLLFLQTNDIAEEAPRPETLRAILSSSRRVVLQPVKKPPLKSEVIRWLKDKEKCEVEIEETVCDSKGISTNVDDLDNSQALGLKDDVLNNSLSLESDDKDKANNSLQVTMQPDGSFLCFGSGVDDNTGVDPATVEIDFLTLMVTEVLTTVRGDLHPDPSIDDIQAIFYTVTNDCPPNHFLQKSLTEILVVDSLPPPKYLDRCIFNVKITYVQNESEILEKIIELVNKHDPDIICGYDIEVNSWGYILERAQVLGLQIVQELSRITEKNRQKRWRNDENDFEGRIIGRVLFNVWRLFRHELALSSYSFENCMYEILKERVPKYSYAQLAEWWGDESRILRWIPVEYYLTRLYGTVRMLEKLDIINRTSELARLFGLQWWEVLSRGSQFRVESLMLRAARPLNLVALSPSVKQRAAMRAPECLPLIFEPESRFYSDPVIVLDFQSLYPSMMIAYNYCFSTCIGRVHNISGDAAYEFGAWRLRIPKAKLETLVKSGLIHWSPVGVGFIKPSVRRGVLPALLRRILAARQAVKKGMKLQTDENVKKAMHSRQLGLKLIANVTYGYTAANFSGRMPCVEVGDSVVAKGRETLERAIKLVRDNSQWNAKVVYGDTDSMFVVVPGGSRADTFRIGQEIADAVTADNPSPVVLKLEKVYQPCILQTKKRYVGFMYESAEQETPVYEAKGIETVRRDGCPAGVKLLQRSLCELFTSGDMSRVKHIVTSTLSQLCDGTLPVHQLFFTREYHGSAGYKPGAAAPPNEISKRIACRDRRAIPRTGTRVSWLVTSGPPNTPLVKLARTPQELIKEPATPHVSYYAARVLLPPLHRCLSLLGANVFKWWNDLGYTREIQLNKYVSMGGIVRYMRRERCTICGARDTRALCQACVKIGGKTAVTLSGRLARAKSDLIHCDQICLSCCGHPKANECMNAECPVLWRRLTARQKLTQVRDVITHLPDTFTCEPLDF